MANKTVEEIVEKAKSGDKSAFDLLYREYSEKLLKYVIKLGADRNDAEDIVSDSFVEAIEHIGDLKNNAFFSTWLHSIAKNKVYTMKKKEQKHARVDFSSDEGDEQNDALDIAVSEAAEYNGDTIMLPEDYAENEDIKQILADTINSLNPDQRDAIYLFYYKNNSISEIAEQAGVSENTIKSRLSLARKYMERKLKALQKGGVTLCAVPIPVILNIVVSESKLKAAAPVMTTAAGGATSGAEVSAVSGKIGALIAAGIMIGGGVGIYSTLSDRSGNIHKGDIRTADSSSVMISDASSIDSRKDWDPDLIKVVDTDTVESTIAVDDASSQTDSRPTNTNQGNTRTTQPSQQQAQPAQPAQQVIEYYDEGTANNAEYEGDNGEQPYDNVSGNNTSSEGSTNESNHEISKFQTDYWYADPLDLEASGISISGINKRDYDIESIVDIVIPSEINGMKVVTIERGSIADLDAGDAWEVEEYNEFPYAAFGMCPNLKSITIENGIQEIGSGAFQGCTSLESINIPNGINKIGDNAFDSCCSIKSLDIPESVMVIGKGAFNNCKSIKELKIPNGCSEISDSLCWGCEDLTNVVIPDGVSTIGNHAFFDCYSLKSVYIPKSVKEIGDYAFGSYNEPSEVRFEFTIYCYKNSAAHKYAIANDINYELLD